MVDYRDAAPILACTVLTIGFLTFSGPALADRISEPVGYIMKVKGPATLTSRGQTIEARVGQAVIEGAILRTGPRGAMGVTLRDNTVMSFGPDSEFFLDEFAFEPARDNLKFSARLSRGTLNFISGVIAKLRPDAVVLKTSTGTIGVEGAHLLVKVSK